jgi:two-component system, chemotaxis family, chemotaxis protein CheY
MASSESGKAAPRVLVVDDSSLVRLYYNEALTRAGFAVEQAINGIEALEKVLASSFDLIIVDVNMPRMDGLAFLHRVRAASAPTSTVIVSTEAGPQDAEAARKAGANFYLVKPVSQADVARHAAVLTGWRS